MTWRTHPLSACLGQACAVHAPSNHHMRDWPKLLRASSLIERVCDHGIGHPDPDSMAWQETQGRGHLWVHGCDGCCAATPDDDGGGSVAALSVPEQLLDVAA